VGLRRGMLGVDREACDCTGPFIDEVELPPCGSAAEACGGRGREGWTAGSTLGAMSYAEVEAIRASGRGDGGSFPGRRLHARDRPQDARMVHLDAGRGGRSWCFGRNGVPNRDLALATSSTRRGGQGRPASFERGKKTCSIPTPPFREDVRPRDGAHAGVLLQSTSGGETTGTGLTASAGADQVRQPSLTLLIQNYLRLIRCSYAKLTVSYGGPGGGARGVRRSPR